EDEGELPVHRQADGEPGGDGDDADDDRQTLGDITGGDWASLLGGMTPVRLDVADVVQQIGAAGDEAEGDERQRGVLEDATLAEHARGTGRGGDEHVLHPLLRTGSAEQAEGQGLTGGSHGATPLRGWTP